MNQDILNDEKIIEELHEKLSEYEMKIKEYEDKKQELNTTLSDLGKKNSIQDISESTKEKIVEVMDKVKEKIIEVDSEIEELNNKTKEINETLSPVPEPPPPPPAPEMPKMSGNENRVRELENKRSQKETERSALETKRSEAETNRNSGGDEHIAKIDEQMQMLEEQKNRLEGTAGSIEGKMNDENINTATYERLEEMYDEVWEKIDELQEKIDELQDKKDEYWDEMIDGLNDKIDEMNDEIDEICDEIDEICDTTVDEDIINEVKKSTGFEDLGSLLNKITDSVNAALFNVKIPDIKIPPIPEIKIRIPGERRQDSSPPPVVQEQKNNVNLSSSKMGARIHSFCCEHSHAERAANLLADDYNEKWCAADNHGKFKTVKPHWVIVDFGAVKTFNYLKMVKCSPGHGHHDDTGNKNYDASAWTFEISNDKDHWVEFNSETSDYSAIYEKNFGMLTGRYVRLHIEAGGSDPKNKHHGVRLYELRFEMRSEDGNITNLCDGASIESCCHGDWGAPVTNLIRTDDPDYHNKWYTEWAHEEKVQNSHWVIIDLGENRTFNHIKIAKASAGKHDFGDKYKDMSAWCAEVSSDMSNWTAFNVEKNDRSAIYEKTFDTQTGRYIRLWVDAAESDPDNKHGHVRLYGVSLEMIDRGDNAGEVTFEDIIAIAPFAKKETLDKLVDKLIATDDLNKVKSLAPFLGEATLNKLISKVSGKADINTIKSLAPFLSRDTLDRLVEELDEDMDFEKIKVLAPFLSREALAKCVVRSGELDMKRLRSLAPFLGSDYIDEIISKML